MRIKIYSYKFTNFALKNNVFIVVIRKKNIFVYIIKDKKFFEIVAHKYLSMKKSIVIALSIVSLLWVIYIIDLIIPINFTSFGILPRSSSGIKGILFAPFLHLNLVHIMSNTLPLLILLSGLFLFYEQVAWRVLALSIIIGNGLVWILGRSLVHVGASGLIFSLVAFFIFSAVFKKSLKSLLLGVFVFFMYGGIIWGVLPGQAGISWEGHLFGFITGGILAYFFRDVAA